MANPIILAAMLARQLVTITCPYCKFQKRVPRKPAAFRVCPSCKRKFDDPVSAKKKKK